jgi:hypothetical protein
MSETSGPSSQQGAYHSLKNVLVINEHGQLTWKIIRKKGGATDNENLTHSGTTTYPAHNDRLRIS